MRSAHPKICRRSIALAGCLLLVLAAAPAAYLAAEPAPAARAPGTAQRVPDDAPSAADLQQAAEALAAAQARSAAADAAYSRMKRHNRPRGAAREAIVRERIQARQALLETRERYEVLQQRARGDR